MTGWNVDEIGKMAFGPKEVLSTGYKECEGGTYFRPLSPGRERSHRNNRDKMQRKCSTPTNVPHRNKRFDFGLQGKEVGDKGREMHERPKSATQFISKPEDTEPEVPDMKNWEIIGVEISLPGKREQKLLKFCTTITMKINGT